MFFSTRLFRFLNKITTRFLASSTLDPSLNRTTMKQYKQIQIGTKAGLCLYKFQIEAESMLAIMLIVCLNEAKLWKPLLKALAFFGYPYYGRWWVVLLISPEIWKRTRLYREFLHKWPIFTAILRNCEAKTAFIDNVGESLLAFM